MLPDPPPCTCFSVPYGGVRYITVYSPYCRRDPRHRRRAQTAYEPTYAKTANYDPDYKKPEEAA